MAQHRWHKEIKAWADGAHIEYRRQYDDGTWSDWAIANYPSWHTALEHEYRVQKEPVITIKYYEYTALDNYAGYIEFIPDIGTRWDLKITLKDDIPIKVELPK